MAFDLNFSVTSIPTRLPRITGSQEVGTVWGLDETGLTGVTARQWAIVGGSNLGTAATQDTTDGLREPRHFLHSNLRSGHACYAAAPCLRRRRAFQSGGDGDVMDTFGEGVSVMRNEYHG